MDYNKLNSLCKEYKSVFKGAIDFKKYTFYAITYHSTSIEGSTLSQSEVFDLLEYGKPAKNKPFTHHQMVVDHYNAVIFIENALKNKTPLTELLIRQINATVLKNTGAVINTVFGTFDSSKGEYRLCSVRAGSRSFPVHKMVPALMKNLIADTKNMIEKATSFQAKCELAFYIHFSFVSIHPFADGNGRTARLLMNYILSYFNLPVFFISKSRKISYINALESAREKKDINIFYKFMFSEYSKFLSGEIKKI